LSKEALLILVRHGESIWNKENRFTGWIDVDLSAKGEEEARSAGERLKKYPITKGYTSALKRAQRTMDLILEVSGHKGIPVIDAEALNERHYGDLQGLNKDETSKKFGAEQVHIWRRSYDIAPPGGESLKMTKERALPFVHGTILPALLKGENCLVVAHGNSLRAMVMELDRMTKEEILELNIPTATPILYRLRIVAPQPGSVPGLPGIEVLEKKVLVGSKVD
jgi:2,3-bisphosphoglycerate-dependent phosphoglycerate mutase